MREKKIQEYALLSFDRVGFFFCCFFSLSLSLCRSQENETRSSLTLMCAPACAVLAFQQELRIQVSLFDGLIMFEVLRSWPQELWQWTKKTSWGVPLRALSRTFFTLPTVFVGVSCPSNRVYWEHLSSSPSFLEGKTLTRQRHCLYNFIRYFAQTDMTLQ